MIGVRFLLCWLAYSMPKFSCIKHLINLYIVDQFVIGLGFQELKLKLDKKEF